MHLFLLRWFLLFCTFSHLGWLCETAYCSLPARRFQNNALLHGPFSPLYGMGALLTVALTGRFSQNLPLLFAASAVICCAAEYTAGFLLEGICGRRFWDYSAHRFHLHGRICLLNGALFGLLGVLTVRVLFPFIWRGIGMLSEAAVYALSAALGAYFLADLSFTLRFSKKRPAAKT